MSFAESAARLAGLAGALLGWRPPEFWAATPAELAQVIAALGQGGDPAPIDRIALKALEEMFPDG